MHLKLTSTICWQVVLGWTVAQKLWIVRTCVALSVLCLFIVSSYVYGLWQVRYYYVEYRLERPLELWALFWVSALLLVMAGVLLGISPAAFFSLRAMRFRSVQFIVSAAIPLLVLVLIQLAFLNVQWYRLVNSLPRYLRSYIFFGFGHVASSVWVGVAMGKALHVRVPPEQGQGERASGSEATNIYRTVVCPSCEKRFSEEHHQCPWCGKRLPTCERCGKHISGLEAERHKNYCIECYRQWLRERPPFF